MPVFKAVNNGRVYKLVDHEDMLIRPSLFGKKVKKDRRGYDTPAVVEFPIAHITSIDWREPGWLSSGKLTITCIGGSNDPWRTDKDAKPWLLKFGSDPEDVKRNRALHLAWMLEMAHRQQTYGASLMLQPMPLLAPLLPTNGERFTSWMRDVLRKWGDKLEEALAPKE